MTLSFTSSSRSATAALRPRPFTVARPAKALPTVLTCAHNDLAAPTTQRDPILTATSQACGPADVDTSLAAGPNGQLHSGRRGALTLLAGAATATTASAFAGPTAAYADDFITLPSGIKLLTIREGEGLQPQPGDTVEVHWAGFTKGYQGKRIDNTSVRDEPYEFKLGAGQAIKAFEVAVQNMRAGGIVRVEVPGDHPELGYPLDRAERFTGELISQDLKIYKYRYGPQPAELGGQRALDFVLDNSTLRDFNRTLLFDIKLLAVRRPRSAAA